MSITASSLIALVQTQGAKEATAQLLEVGAASDTAGTKLKSLAVGGLLVAGAAAIGVGAASVKMAADFEQSTNLLITSANEVPGNIDMIRKGLLQMSVDTATPVDELTKGMFNIESAGYHGAAALKVETAAAEGAKVENADLAAVTDVLTTAMHNYNLPASQAVDVMNSFRMAASIGKMRMDDLTGALTNVLPIASQAHVKLSDVEAALSTMSLAGDKGAMAGTHLQMMLTQLLAPSSKASGVLKEVGLTTQQIADEMKVSLPGAVQMITDAVGKKFPVGSAAYIAAISDIVGGSKSMKAIMELSGVSLKTFTDDAEQLAPTMKANSTAVDGWNVVQSNFNFKMGAAKDAVDALMITLGTKLLPVVGKVADAVTPLIQDFTGWISGSDKVCSSMDRLTGFVMTMVGDVKTFATGIEGAVDKSGLFQSALQLVKDILPDVSKFLIQAGSAINDNLLPPVESLIVNVGSLVSGFITWADKSGAASTAIGILGGAVQATTVIVGGLIQATSDIIGWFEQGGVQVQVLAGLVGGLGTAFVAIKIADTISGFQKMFAAMQAGDGIISSLATSFKGKFSAAIDDFLSSQAPNLKASMDSVKVSAEEAVVAEEEVAAAPADQSAEGWFARLETSLGTVGTSADGASVQVGSIGAAAETSAGEVALSSTEMEGSLARVGGTAATTEGEIATVGTTAATAGTATAGLGLTAAAAALPIAALGLIAYSTYELIANKAYDTDKSVQTSTGEMVQANQLRYHQMATGARETSQQIDHDMTTNMNNTKNNVTTAAQKMAQDVVNAGNEMADKMIAKLELMRGSGVTSATKFSDSVMRVFNEMKTSGIQSLSDLDDSAKSYLQEIQDYVDAMNGQLNLAKDNLAARKDQRTQTKTTIIGRQGYASGTDYVPQSGMYTVGEHGTEQVWLPQGAKVIPHDQIGSSGSWSGGGSNSNQPIHVHVHIADQEFEYLTSAMMDKAARMARLNQPRRAYL